MTVVADSCMGLIDVLKNVTDPRGLRGRRFSSHSILSICVLATLSGANSLRAISDWASSLSRRDLRSLGIRRSKPPSESAIRKFLAKVDPEEVDSMTGAWLISGVSCIARGIRQCMWRVNRAMQMIGLDAQD